MIRLVLVLIKGSFEKRAKNIYILKSFRFEENLMNKEIILNCG